MNYDDSEARSKLRDWLVAQDFTVFGTLKFTDGSELTDTHGERTVRAFFSALDRAYFGHAVENVGMRHKRVVFRHTGISNTNLHYHFLAKPHTAPLLYAQLASKQWAKMSSWTMGASNTQIELVRSEEATATYILHEYGKQGADCICLSASSLQPPSRSAHSYRNLAQLRRLLKLQQNEADEHWISKAGCVRFVDT
ncbi:hypothetical protein [Ruegeria atlantica]|uniref:hypothetical protein n=1 Tax=Ruegeria atlantica TaxID=81569 RepID=UPI00147D4DFA|nr:hypothetical protein [Ruegeria atlantica]